MPNRLDYVVKLCVLLNAPISTKSGWSGGGGVGLRMRHLTSVVIPSESSLNAGFHICHIQIQKH